MIGGLVGCVALPSALLGQQVADTAFRPPIAESAYQAGQGPVVLIDEGHNNFHTASGRYLPFANLLRRDGYVVVPLAGKLTLQALRDASVLVIAYPQRSPDGPAYALEEVTVAGRRFYPCFCESGVRDQAIGQ